MTDLFESMASEILRLKRENTSLSKKLSVAIEGLEVLLSDGNINGIPQKTLEEIKSYDKELPQNANTEERNNIEDQSYCAQSDEICGNMVAMV